MAEKKSLKAIKVNNNKDEDMELKAKLNSASSVTRV